ncbi:FliA/WhiG family RNA polymerase sigma factor [Peristeroidobacter soli]|jgi:RNA polymerase sigma factor for flagellar operon FliA|uniref:FliA/WhiG family RNA polymerase sigma factor n=1 Tax=Peristeroidobacter soli TaxID=2497877 RepID=UPI00101D78BD|nr:FliA/WhiG family RNA polymerase sigma factor [Peristeroidobacter soli]
MQAGYAVTDEFVAAPLSAADEQRLLVTFAPLVKRVVKQLELQTGGGIDREDLQQIGLMGLLDAVRRYGTPDEKFPAYASVRVRGAILDELRRQDWRPRTVRQETHRVRDGVRELAKKLGREPTPAEIQQALGLTVEQYQEHQLAQSAEQLANFDELLQQLTEQSGDRRHSPESHLLLQRSIEQALRRLNDREQRVVQLYYEFDLSLKEIARVLDLTEARVCQINKLALKKLRELLQ